MKKLFLCSMLVFLNFVVKGQSKTEFEKFINSFYLCPYPYIDSYDFDKKTKVNTTARDIEKNLHATFVLGQGIRPVPINCELEDFIEYDCYIQFPPTDSVYVLVLSPDMRDPACGEGNLIVTYSKYNYQLQDTLWISLRGALEPQYIDGQKIACSLDIESIIMKDSICIERKETYTLRLNNVPKSQKRYRKVKTILYNITYKMTEGGKFIKIREDRKDEISNPLAEKLKEPLIREYE